MESSVQTPIKENHDIPSPRPYRSDKSDPNGEQEPTTPPTAQDNNAPPAADVVIDITAEGDLTPSQQRMDPSNNDDGVKSEPISSPSESEESQHLIPRNSKMEKACIPQDFVLYQAALKGDWKTAKLIFDTDPSAIAKKISDRDTALHIAAAAKHISFVEKLVQLSSSSNLATKNANGNTALAFAAASGVVRIAEVMVDKNPNLTNLVNDSGQTPIFQAILFKRKDMASYLFSKTNFEDLHTSQQFQILIVSITSDYYDIALDILIKKPELARERDDENGFTALHILAKKPFAIGSSNELSFWKRHINSCFNGIFKAALMQTLAHQVVERIWNFLIKDFSTFEELDSFILIPSDLMKDAARVGNAELLIILIRSYPELVWLVDDKNKTIFHVAVENRQENVFCLIYEIGGLKDFLANFYNEKNNCNILHLAAMVASPYHLNRVSGAALQMQRELLWFKEVEKIVSPYHYEMRYDPLQELSTVEIRSEDHDDSITARELFTKEHKQLLKDGEEWMKNTANSCMLVATLIATVVFAAAFTVPGGNDNDGTPIFKHNQAFTVFVISDVAALVMSTTSILTFLSILTSRYAEEDFLMSLPIKLLFGLVTLFVSIACMVVAFSATFFIAYSKTKAKIPLVIAAVIILPIGCFCAFHFKLVIDILQSSYWPQFSLKKQKKRLF